MLGAEADGDAWGTGVRGSLGALGALDEYGVDTADADGPADDELHAAASSVIAATEARIETRHFIGDPSFLCSDSGRRLFRTG